MVKIQTPRFADGKVAFVVTELTRSRTYMLRVTGPAEFGTAEREFRADNRAAAAPAVDFDDPPAGRYVARVLESRDDVDTVVAERSFHAVGPAADDDDREPPTRVQLSRTATARTPDTVLTDEIMRVTRAREFRAYQAFVNDALLRETGGAFSSQAYEVIIRATREFLAQDTTSIIDPTGTYLRNGNLPYLENVASRYPDARGGQLPADVVADIDEELLDRPAPVELIWTYWLEESGFHQVLNHVLARFQNRRLPRGSDALTRFSLSYLRPLRNLLYTWGDHEIDRLTVRRRAAEYQYEYGLDLIGRAVPGSLRYVERRSQFLESFHTLLHEALVFYRLDDDTTVVADGFPMLNALRDTHRVLAEGAENQFDGVALQSRVEAMAMQLVLAQPEMREFLGGRPMVPYDEPWMDRVDTMRTLLGWGDTSVTHFHELAVHGEQLVMTVRWGDWSQAGLTADSAANWARLMRDVVHRYVHAYRTVTGVDLHQGVDATMPAVLLAQRNRARQRA